MQRLNNIMTNYSAILKAQSAKLRWKVESFLNRVAFFVSVFRFEFNALSLIDSCFLWRGHGSIPKKQAIRNACPGYLLMAIRSAGRIRKYLRKGGRRLGSYMTERIV